MKKEKLDEILELHKKWLNGEKEGKKADLRGVYLRGADLRDADLRYADLEAADLREADLTGADLKGADLKRADLREAVLEAAILQNADLRGANLNGANIDFSCLPLWCGSIGVKMDSKQLSQLVYHAICNMDKEELNKFLENPLDYANKFHRIGSDNIKKIEVK